MRDPLRPMMQGARLLFSGDGHHAASFRNVILLLANDQTTEDHMQRVKVEHDRMHKDYRDGLGLVVVIRANAPPPSEETRRMISRYNLKMSATTIACAQVILGTGFAAAAKRAALNLVNMTFATAFTTRTFGTIEEGTSWLVGKMEDRAPRGLTAERLAAALREFQRHVELLTESQTEDLAANR